MALFLRTTSAVIALRPVAHRLVAACLADPADDLLAAEFLQIVGGAAGTVLRLGLFAEGPDPTRQIGSREAMG